jgi:hypothetical protein
MNWFKISTVATALILLGMILFVTLFATLRGSRGRVMRVGEMQKIRFQAVGSR